MLPVNQTTLEQPGPTAPAHHLSLYALGTAVAIASFCGLVYVLVIDYIFRKCGLSSFTSQNYGCPVDVGGYWVPIIVSLLGVFLLNWFGVFQTLSRAFKILLSCLAYAAFYFILVAVFTNDRMNLFGEDLEPLGTAMFLPIVGWIVALVIATFMSLKKMSSKSEPRTIFTWCLAVLLSSGLAAASYILQNPYSSLNQSYYAAFAEFRQNQCDLIQSVNVTAMLKDGRIYYTDGVLSGIIIMNVNKAGLYLIQPKFVTTGSEYVDTTFLLIEKNLQTGLNEVPFSFALIDYGDNPQERFRNARAEGESLTGRLYIESRFEPSKEEKATLIPEQLRRYNMIPYRPVGQSEYVRGYLVRCDHANIRTWLDFSSTHEYALVTWQ